MQSARPTSVARVIPWARDLISLVVELPLEGFRPGQFVRAGWLDGERFVARAYSLASCPGQPGELLVALVPEGEVTPRLFTLRPGDPVWLGHAIAGHFTLDTVPPAETLWLFATGAGLAPFVSILRSGAPFEKFARVVVVHGTRFPEQLAYRDELASMPLVYVPCTTRGTAPGVYDGRITRALDDGTIERRAGARLGPEGAQVMVCGNPAMVDDVVGRLAERGLRKSRSKTPGQITTEPYW
ncbi:ferredoxin--NADP reductase [Myxococcota bacterium]|nr:ferredoxin--NADP reductase [Myxococcota bacterium]